MVSEIRVVCDRVPLHSPQHPTVTIGVFFRTRAGEVRDLEVRASGAELGVVVAFGQLLPVSLLESLPHGFVNLHFSLLPRWRGAAPVERAILAGDVETGVDLMRIEAGLDTPYFQTGETKYGKPILDRVLTQHTPLADATKCVLVSFDSTMRSNLSVGMPIDLICYERDSLEVQWRRRFDEGDPYFTALSDEWGEGTRKVFRHLPELRW